MHNLIGGIETHLLFFSIQAPILLQMSRRIDNQNDLKLIVQTFWWMLTQKEQEEWKTLARQLSAANLSPSGVDELLLRIQSSSNALVEQHSNHRVREKINCRIRTV